MSVLVVGEGWRNGRRSPRHVFHSQADRVFSHDRLARARVGSHKDTIALFEMVNCLFLEVVQLERELYARSGGAKSRTEQTVRAFPSGAGTQMLAMSRDLTLCAMSGTRSWKFASVWLTSTTCAQSRLAARAGFLPPRAAAIGRYDGMRGERGST